MPWHPPAADATELQTLLKLDKVMLVNDFLASGYGLLTLGRQDVCHVICPLSVLLCVNKCCWE
jgi:glucokinase